MSLDCDGVKIIELSKMIDFVYSEIKEVGINSYEAKKLLEDLKDTSYKLLELINNTEKDLKEIKENAFRALKKYKISSEKKAKNEINKAAN